MNIRVILNAILISRLVRLFLTMSLHNLLVRYRLLYPILMIISLFFWHNVYMSLGLLALSFIIYAGPVLTNKRLIRLEKKLERTGRIQEMYRYQSWRLIFAKSPQEFQIASQKIKKLNLLDKDFKLAMKMINVIRITTFIIMTLAIATASCWLIIWLL